MLYRDLKLPLVVALDNWRQVGVPLDRLDLVHLFGLVEVRGFLDTHTAQPKDVHWAHRDDDGSSLAPGRSDYISAVAVPWPDRRVPNDDFSVERPMYVRVIHNPFATVQLPLPVFAGVKDGHIVYEGGSWLDVLPDSGSP